MSRRNSGYFVSHPVKKMIIGQQLRTEQKWSGIMTRRVKTANVSSIIMSH